VPAQLSADTRRLSVQQLIVNAMGPDRPGIVGQFTGHLHEGGANVLESRMVNLRGQFAIIALFEAEEAAAEKLRQSLPALAKGIGMRLTVTDAEAPVAASPGIPFRLKTYSMDQPGILHGVSDVLRIYGVNIEDLSARQESAAFMGTSLFLVEMKLTVPSNVPIKELRTRLQVVCDGLNCDVDFEPA
jgi:glycine cleavage system transcriptional repressor